MRKYVIACVDNKTNMKLVYSECSYNMACMELEKEMTAQGKHFISARSEGNNIMRIEFSDNNVFYYDEERGVVVQEGALLPNGYQFFEEVANA